MMVLPNWRGEIYGDKQVLYEGKQDLKLPLRSRGQA